MGFPSTEFVSKNPSLVLCQAVTPPAPMDDIERILLEEQPLKMDGWKINFLLGNPIFRCYVSFRECKSFERHEVFLPDVIFIDLGVFRGSN